MFDCRFFTSISFPPDNAIFFKFAQIFLTQGWPSVLTPPLKSLQSVLSTYWWSTLRNDFANKKKNLVILSLSTNLLYTIIGLKSIHRNFFKSTDACKVYKKTQNFKLYDKIRIFSRKSTPFYTDILHPNPFKITLNLRTISTILFLYNIAVQIYMFGGCMRYVCSCN